MNRCSFCEWIPILPWPVWPLAGQFLLGQNVVVGSMIVLLAVCGSIPRGVCLDPIFFKSEVYHGRVQSYHSGTEKDFSFFGPRSLYNSRRKETGEGCPDTD